MKISEISIEGLFGTFDHKIPLNLDERITIIHGPNGFGKTILFKMVSGLFNQNYSEIRNVPFQLLTIKFNNGNEIKVKKHIIKNQKKKNSKHIIFNDLVSIRNKRIRIEVTYSTNTSKKNLNFDINDHNDLIEMEFPLDLLEKFIGPIRQVGPNRWHDRFTERILNLEEVLDRYGHHLDRIGAIEAFQEPKWWKDILKRIEIHLIESQRLFNIQEKTSLKKNSRMIPSVTIYSEELAETINQKLAESAELSQSLDRTFPVRLVEKMGMSDLTPAQLKEKLSELEKKRSRLKVVGLLDKEEDMGFLPDKDLVANTKDVLAIYIEDVEKKLGIFDDIANRIELFKSIIESRFLYKKIIFSKEKGFSFTNLNNERLPLDKLSSGEQHELVLLYQLLFKVKPDALILIDEPELSLHVVWQQQFLESLQEITKLSLFDVLIATHSPQIIHDRWDLTVELKGPEV